MAYVAPLYKVVHKFGRNNDVDAAEDVWGPGGTILWQTTAQTLTVTITGANAGNDDGSPAGTGARTLTIEGLDGDWNEVSETVTLNGATPVITTQTFIRAYRAYVVTAGSSLSNEGLITITYTTTTNNALAIAIGEGQSQFAGFTIPAGKLGFVASVQFSQSGTQVADFKFWRHDGATANSSKRLQLFFDGISQPTLFTPRAPLGPYPVGTDIWWSVSPASTNQQVSVNFEIWLINDDAGYYPAPWPIGGFK